MMKLNVWNTKEARFETKSFVTPTFVLNEKTFALRVQGEHLEYMSDTLTAAAVAAKEKADALTAAAKEAAAKADAKEADAIAAERIAHAVKVVATKKQADERAAAAAKAAEIAKDAAKDAEQAAAKARVKAVDAAAALAAFTAANKPESVAADSIATAYAAAVGISKVTFDSAEKVSAKVKEYAIKYLGTDSFDDARKADVLTARKAVNVWLADLFGTRDSVYKVHALELNARWFDTVAAASIGAVRPDTVSLSDGDVIALNLKPLKRDAVALVIVRAMFSKYGCAVKVEQTAAAPKKHSL